MALTNTIPSGIKSRQTVIIHMGGAATASGNLGTAVDPAKCEIRFLGCGTGDTARADNGAWVSGWTATTVSVARKSIGVDTAIAVQVVEFW